MLRGIDHIVIAVHSLDEARKVYGDLGFVVVEGGKHPYGSYNNLIGFQDGSYIELLGFYEESPDHAWWDLLHERGGGLIDFCMQTDDIRADHAALKAQGVEMSELAELTRDRPDGYHLSWINNKTFGKYQGIVPFIIEDQTPRDERVPKERTHSNGVTGIDTLTLVTGDLALVKHIFSGLDGITGEDITRNDLQADGIRYRIGAHQIDYLTPTSDDSPLRTWLDANKPVPYSVTFKTSGEPKTYTAEQTLGVNMQLVK